jgi:hypothetical protein
VDYYCDGEKVLEAYYSSVRNVVSVEEVRVRFGTYDAVRIEETATVLAGDVEEVVTSTTWYLPGVGELKVITDSSEGRSTTRLTDTNLTPVPEPSTAACVATVLATLAILRRRG